jgi:LacI family gluconate utilization system Gnt-I transcriptional repressor
MSAPRKTPTMADVARLAGVSPMTVSRAFKADASVSATTRAAIHRAADELGYVFDSTASNLRSQRTHFVAVTVPSLNNANFAETVRGLSDGLKARGLQILLGATEYDVEEEERLIGQLLRRRPEAIVVTGGRHTPRARRLLQNAAIPVIETWDLPSQPIGHVVGFSNAGAARELVDHFIARGMTRIGFVGGDAQGDDRGADRRAGFVAAMGAHGLDATRLIPAGEAPVSMREGARAMGRLLDAMPDCEAAICVSDLVAFGALSECQRRGVAVPQRLSLAGFGDYEIAAVCAPSLTTVNPFPREIGARAAALILDVLDGTRREPATIVIAPKLLARASSR